MSSSCEYLIIKTPPAISQPGGFYFEMAFILRLVCVIVVLAIVLATKDWLNSK